ncbi:lytic transglycosylase domain-containing protein [bacterium]|nr:lytic transglycosylase domain-containing protein [candidate division CSSED10-310 bacterium]
MSVRGTITAICIIVFFNIQADARFVYEYTDAEGVVHITQHPPHNKTAKKIRLRYTRASRQPVSSGTITQVEEALTQAADRHGLNPALLKALAQVESGFNPLAVSPAGAEGVLQLMPATARRFAVDNSFDLAQNIEGSCKYLRELMRMFDGDLPKVLAAYNAGEQNVISYGGIPPFDETRAFVTDVLELFSHYGGPKIDAPPASGSKPAKPSGATGSGRVRRYVDHHGTIHLTNR